MYVAVHACMCVCVCVYIYIYIYIGQEQAQIGRLIVRIKGCERHV